ncbi:MAG: hypothetical protein A3J75_00910 [Acidobacteria bacterium RBG_16_68_9]|nr:MAG: hypothetical protein A3J75_00910 [Acidobacteria bacterium RBG_16_68_9]
MQHRLGPVTPVAVLTVSELSQQLKTALEIGCGEVWVGGEISNFRVPPSGHYYFSLKDERSQIAAVMFRSANQALPFRPHDGIEVIVRGRVGLYEVRGDLQLYVETMEPRGVGSLLLAFEQLKQRLAAEGLFDSARKRALPLWPEAVGVATGLTGAAVHDIVTTIRARLPGTRIVVRPVRVQGRGAGEEIVAALEDLNRLPGIDVIIVGRGGGSLEDLWAFNEEGVVRAVARSRVPVVSAVGHEIDVTLTDLAADRRAATPTAAGALVVPDRDELGAQLGQLQLRLRRATGVAVARDRARMAALARMVRHPQQLLRAQRLRLDELVERGQRALDGVVRLARQGLRGQGERIEALSPLAVLQRGYAIAQRVDTGQVVRRASDVTAEDALRLTFGRGWARVRVEERQE